MIVPASLVEILLNLALSASAFCLENSELPPYAEDQKAIKSNI